MRGTLGIEASGCCSFSESVSVFCCVQCVRALWEVSIWGVGFHFSQASSTPGGARTLDRGAGSVCMSHRACGVMGHEIMVHLTSRLQ